MNERRPGRHGKSFTTLISDAMWSDFRFTNLFILFDLFNHHWFTPPYTSHKLETIPLSFESSSQVRFVLTEHLWKASPPHTYTRLSFSRLCVWLACCHRSSGCARFHVTAVSVCLDGMPLGVRRTGEDVTSLSSHLWLRQASDRRCVYCVWPPLTAHAAQTSALSEFHASLWNLTARQAEDDRVNVMTSSSSFLMSTRVFHGFDLTVKYEPTKTSWEDAVLCICHMQVS